MVGSTISHYRVTTKVGQGGMGEVYRATDTKLDREVAIKVLPESFSQDKERLARFEREAKTLASLDHPNIGSIYGIEETEGKRCLILQLIEGETLTEKLRTGALPIDEALEVCTQIAEALEAAHAKGIIHRDLKPANVKITPEGKVKVLDFGLAKATIAESSVAPSDNSQSPTLTADHTRPGMILGTAAYMSPEQARGKPVDKRSDIWSFGCVLYECLTGKCLFRGEDVTETLATVIKGEPRWSDVPTGTPLPIQWLIRKCLVKDRKERLHDISDAKVFLNQAIADPNWGMEPGQFTSAGSTRGISTGVLTVAFVLTGLIAIALGWFLKPTTPMPEQPEPRQVEVVLQGTNGLHLELGNAFALSPDGKKLAYSVKGPRSPLHVLSLVDGVDREIPGTEDGRHPFFSSDGRSLGFTTEKELKTIALEGGSPRALRASVTLGGRGASWSESDNIVFSPEVLGGLWLIESNGVESRPLTTLKPGDWAGDWTHVWPQWLPDGEHVLFMVGRDGNFNAVNGQIEVVEVATGKRKVLRDGCTYGQYVSSGHVLYVIDESLYAQEFDLGELELKGKQTLVLQGLEANIGGAVQYAVSRQGDLAYLTGGSRDGSRKLVWLDLQGNTEDASAKKGSFMNRTVLSFGLSPDDKRVALSLENDIQLLELETDLLRPFTLGGTTNIAPVWTPDGQSIVFASNRGGKRGVWQKKVNFTNKAKLLFPQSDYLLWPYSFSSDGETLFGVAVRAETSWDIWVHTLGQNNVSPRFILDSSANESWPTLSPDGRWLVCFSDNQLYVKPFGREGTVQQLTTGGGHVPRWSEKGDRIFYEDRGTIWSIPMTAEGEAIKPGRPEEKVKLPRGFLPGQWGINSDETRFLVLVEDEDETEEGQRPIGLNSVNIVFNWFTELNMKAPVK